MRKRIFKLKSLHRPRPRLSHDIIHVQRWRKSIKKYFQDEFSSLLSSTLFWFAFFLFFSRVLTEEWILYIWGEEIFEKIERKEKSEALKKNIQPDDIIYYHEFGAWRRALIWWIFALLYIIFLFLFSHHFP